MKLAFAAPSSESCRSLQSRKVVAGDPVSDDNGSKASSGCTTTSSGGSIAIAFAMACSALVEGASFASVVFVQ
jgi:hypothetical protein